MTIKQGPHFSFTFHSRSQKEEARFLVGTEVPSVPSTGRHSSLTRDIFSKRLTSAFLTTDPKQAPSAHAVLEQPHTFNLVKEKLFRLGMVLEVKFDGHSGERRPVLMARPLQGFLPKRRASQSHLQAPERIAKNLVQIESQAERLFYSLQDLQSKSKSRHDKLDPALKNRVSVLADMLGASPESFFEDMSIDPRVLSFAALAAEQHNASLVFVPLRDTPYVLPNRPFEPQPKAVAALETTGSAKATGRSHPSQAMRFVFPERN